MNDQLSLISSKSLLKIMKQLKTFGILLLCLDLTGCLLYNETSSESNLIVNESFFQDVALDAPADMKS